MITIPVVTERCAGIDVGKRGLAVARLTSPAGKEGLDRDSMVRDHGSGTGVVEELDNGGGSHYSSDGKHGLILDSSEERAGERPACRAGLLKEVCRGCGTDAESGSERGCGTKPRRTERRRRNGCGATEAGLAEEFATRRPGELSNRKNRRSRSPFPAAAAKSAGASRDSGRGRLIRIRLSGRCPTAHPQQAPPTIAPPDRNGVREEKQCRTQDVILHLGNIFEANASLYSPGAHTTATSITRRVDSVFSRLLSRPHALHVTPSKDAPKPSC